MLFTEKFNKAIEIIEENLVAEVSSVSDMIGREWGVTKRQAGEYFSFFTDMYMSDYMKKRRLEKILSYMIKHPEAKIEDVVEPYGYSERSSFERAVNREYGVSAAKIYRGYVSVDLMTPLTIEKLMEGDYMNIDTLRMVTQKPDVSSDIDSELITEFSACKDAYGLTLEQVILAHSLVDKQKKISLDSICQRMVENYPEKSADSFSKFDMDCLYLVINFELLKEEAEQIVRDIRETVKIDIRQDDTAYFMLAQYIRWEDVSFIDKFTYQEYIEFKPFIEKLMREAGYSEENAQEYCDCYFDLFELATEYSKEEIATISSALKNELKLTLYYKDSGYWTRDSWGAPITIYDVREVVNEMEAHGITDFEKYDKRYMDFVEGRNFDYTGKRLFGYDSYLEARELLDKMNVSVSAAYNRIPYYDKNITVDKVVSEGKNLAHERMLKAKNGIKYDDGLDFAKSMMNRFNGEEAMYELVGKTYPELAWFNSNAFFGRIPADNNATQRTSLIVAANAKCSIEEAEVITKNVMQDNAQSPADRRINNLFIKINLFAANNRPSQAYRFITYDEFNVAIDEVLKRGYDNIYAKQELYLGLFVFAYGAYNEVAEAVKAVSEALERVAMYDGREKYWMSNVPVGADRNKIIDCVIFARNMFCQGPNYFDNMEDKTLPIFVEPVDILNVYREKFNNKKFEELTTEEINNIWNASVNK